MRQARLEAGLTLAQVAGSQLSRQAVHQVENGKARPTPQLLELIAERTGKPVSFFLLAASTDAADSAIDARELQLSCHERRFDDAVVIAERLLALQPRGRVAAEIHYWLAHALVQLSRPEEALVHARAARALATKVSDPWLVVECLDCEAGALYLQENPAALATTEEALARARELQPRLPRTEARILEHLGAIHVRNHRLDEAIACYREAIETAGEIRDLARLGRIYHGISIAYRERGLLDRASEYGQRALALYTLEHDHVLTARAENELGLLLMRQGDLVGAEQWLQRALVHFEESHVDRLQSHVLLSLGELNLARGDADAADDFTSRGLRLAEQFDEVLARATGYQLRARVSAARGDWESAQAGFVAAIDLLRRLELTEKLALVHADFARALDTHGDHLAAAAHWRSAAELALPTLARAESNA